MASLPLAGTARLPILAGMIVFGEPLPGGARGVARVAAFVAVAGTVSVFHGFDAERRSPRLARNARHADDRPAAGALVLACGRAADRVLAFAGGRVRGQAAQHRRHGREQADERGGQSRHQQQDEAQSQGGQQLGAEPRRRGQEAEQDEEQEAGEQDPAVEREPGEPAVGQVVREAADAADPVDKIVDDVVMQLSTLLANFGLAIDWGWFRWFMYPIFWLLRQLFANLGALQVERVETQLLEILLKFLVGEEAKTEKPDP